MKRPLTGLLTAGVLALAACGSSESDPAPTACQAEAEAYLVALEEAPERALLEGSVPISACLVADQSSGELNTIGAAMIAAATRLNREVQSQPGGEAAVKLGYLVGSVEQAASETGGIHTDLVRRINSAARFSEDGEGLPASFERAFGQAYAAARGSG